MTLLGEAHQNAKLTNAKVHRIRLLWALPGRSNTLKSLGKIFGVSHTTIRDVVIGKAWGHVK